MSRPPLPAEGSAVLVRTDFTDPAAWKGLCAAIAEESDDGFLAYALTVDDEEYSEATPDELRAAHTADEESESFFLVADTTALHGPGFPILVEPVPYGPGFEELDDEPRPPFRVTASALWSVENNLSLANMDWADFTAALDADGVFRGF